MPLSLLLPGHPGGTRTVAWPCSADLGGRPDGRPPDV